MQLIYPTTRGVWPWNRSCPPGMREWQPILTNSGAVESPRLVQLAASTSAPVEGAEDSESVEEEAPPDSGKVIRCDEHGAQPVTYFCQHVAHTLDTGAPVGFFWAESSDPFPDAWCSACHERHVRCGYAWEGEAAEHLGIELLCAGCYLRARKLALGV